MIQGNLFDFCTTPAPMPIGKSKATKPKPLTRADYNALVESCCFFIIAADQANTTGDFCLPCARIYGILVDHFDKPAEQRRPLPKKTRRVEREVLQAVGELWRTLM